MLVCSSSDTKLLPFPPSRAVLTHSSLPDAPRYTTALIVATSAITFGILCMLTIWWINVRENKRKEAICAAPDYVPQPNQEFLDLTDR